MDNIQEIFNTITSSNDNTVANMLKWLQEGIVEKSESAEKEVLAHFSDVADKQNVNFEEFKGALEKLSASKNISVEDTVQRLAAGNGLPNALNQAATALGFK
ncbi:uncharacterized protein LOC113238876 [Hyposmocoma kahamanoa]|uniref:uncharacterized protein LOC113238876 n=1 Tax=Hyposmocoma kahamanoa TaxID=1477025 RepID=UPI000E6D6296|nr:uncharacterized protein LOC113238876 [Hyposmocoma kahamanoa]